MRDPVLAGGVPSIPEFRPLRRNVFAARAQRFAALAPGHALEGYLRLAAALAAAQDAELAGFADAPIPAAAQLEQCRRHGLPPLSVDAARPAVWREGLKRILDRLDRAALPVAASRSVAALSEASGEALERDAANLLAGSYAEIEPGRVPFLGAALQVFWAKRALALGVDGRSAGVAFGLCPVCGSPPVASVVRSGGAEQGLRYLVCSLCASEWHVVRVTCTACASTKSVSYLFVEGGSDTVKAECCDECKTYLKIIHLDRDNRLEPQADDIATLALDMLVDAQGYRRIGPNLLLAPGG